MGAHRIHTQHTQDTHIIQTHICHIYAILRVPLLLAVYAAIKADRQEEEILHVFVQSVSAVAPIGRRIFLHIIRRSDVPSGSFPILVTGGSRVLFCTKYVCLGIRIHI